MPKVFADCKLLGIIEAKDRFYKAMFPTDDELESWITEWAKDLYGSLYVEPTDHQRTMAIKMARAILRKAQEK
jgi:cob(I)alamin adenosyltransferase